MATISPSDHHHNHPFSTTNDPILPFLISIKEKLDKYKSAQTESNSSALEKVVYDCIRTFQNIPRYQNDFRFLKVWFLYMDCVGDFESVYREMEDRKICYRCSMLYETFALFLEAKGRFEDAHRFYCIGISRNAEPIERLKKAHSLFLERMCDVVKACSMSQNITNATEFENSYVNPWSPSTINDIEHKILPQMTKYEGYFSYSKEYPGKVTISTLNNSSRNKILKIGGRDYHIKGCAGQGGFAQVFKACVSSDPDEVVALKIQKPPFPWEFYIYRQLDKRIPAEERSSFGFAQRMHHYSDYSILVCDYLPNGTLQDAINSYVVVGAVMEEVSCIYYTIEMLHILENLHGAGIIHGDFKPDNLLIRYSRENPTIDEDDFRNRRGPWHEQGLCLVDWGRGIDLSLFPPGVEFMGDNHTSGFCCVEMQENKPWKYQVDTYGLCVNVCMMLQGSYMEIEKRTSSDGGYIYLPKISFKRYWNSQLWENLFKRLLNVKPLDDHQTTLRELRESFQNYILSNPSLISKLRHSLHRQKSCLCSS